MSTLLDQQTEVHIQLGNGAPAFLPTALGQHYIDIANRRVYQSVGINSVEDWALPLATMKDIQELDLVGDKADVGLGNVENYGVASRSEAELGQANDRYMTPLRVTQLLNALFMPVLDTFMARRDNPHQVTAEQVGALTSEATQLLLDEKLAEGDLAAVAFSGDYDDLSDKPFIPSTPGDIGAATAAQGDKADTAVQPAALTAALADKVDKVTGYDLSQENFTPAEKAKLASLDEAHYKGTYVNLAALEAAHPTASAGNYADVDAGAGDPVLRYIWDASDSEWVAQAGIADPVTAAQVKTLYESNADTNAFTDAEKAKLGGVATGATANPDTDSLGESGTPTNKWFTEARVRAAVLTGLSLADSAVVAATDTVLQAIGKLAARLAMAFDRANHTGEQAISTVTGLQAALDGKAAAMTTRTISGTSGTLVPSDAGKLIICTSASAVTLTIQLESGGAWADASAVHILQLGAGRVTVSDGSGITVNVFSGLTKALRGQYASAALIRAAADSFALSGMLGGTPA